MNRKHRPSYGVLSLTPRLLRRLRQEWSAVEPLPAVCPPTGDAGGAPAKVIPFPTGTGGWPPPAGAQRMLAA